MKFRKVWIAGMMALLTQGAAAELTNGLYAAFDTTMGSFTCRLDYAEAPLTCANFVGLAEGSQSWVAPQTGGVQADPFYDDLIFHRVITNFMIQGGCPLGNGTSGPGYAFPDEFSTNLSHHSAGILSMANSGPDSNGSQFFITLDATSHLNNKHSVFGAVVDGMNIVSNIGVVATDATNHPLIDVVMNSIQILRVGDDALAFDPVDQPLPEVSPHSLSITSGVPVDVMVMGITNQCEVRLFNSTNLIDWADFATNYFPATTESWVQSASTNHSAEYFKAAQIYYPQAVTAFSDIEGHTLSFTQGTNSIVFYPEAEGVGSCTIDGVSYAVTFWEDWTSGPYVGTVVFQPEGSNGRGFDLSISGNCDGYKHVGYWLGTGEFTFTDTPPTP